MQPPFNARHVGGEGKLRQFADLALQFFSDQEGQTGSPVAEESAERGMGNTRVQVEQLAGNCDDADIQGFRSPWRYLHPVISPLEQHIPEKKSEIMEAIPALSNEDYHSGVAHSGEDNEAAVVGSRQCGCNPEDCQMAAQIERRGSKDGVGEIGDMAGRGDAIAVGDGPRPEEAEDLKTQVEHFSIDVFWFTRKEETREQVFLRNGSHLFFDSRNSPAQAATRCNRRIGGLSRKRTVVMHVSEGVTVIPLERGMHWGQQSFALVRKKYAAEMGHVLVKNDERSIGLHLEDNEFLCAVCEVQCAVVKFKLLGNEDVNASLAQIAVTRGRVWEDMDLSQIVVTRDALDGEKGQEKSMITNIPFHIRAEKCIVEVERIAEEDGEMEICGNTWNSSIATMTAGEFRFGIFRPPFSGTMQQYQKSDARSFTEWKTVDTKGTVEVRGRTGGLERGTVSGDERSRLEWCFSTAENSTEMQRSRKKSGQAKRKRDNWAEEENKEFMEFVKRHAHVEEMKLRRMLAVKFQPRRTHEQCANHLRILRTQGKLPPADEGIGNWQKASLGGERDIYVNVSGISTDAGGFVNGS